MLSSRSFPSLEEIVVFVEVSLVRNNSSPHTQGSGPLGCLHPVNYTYILPGESCNYRVLAIHQILFYEFAYMRSFNPNDHPMRPLL